MNVHLDLSTDFDGLLPTHYATNGIQSVFLTRTWLEEIAWLHWLDDKLPNTLKFFSSNKKPVTADFLPSSWLAKNHMMEELLFWGQSRMRFISCTENHPTDLYELNTPGKHGLAENKNQSVFQGHADFEQRLMNEWERSDEQQEQILLKVCLCVSSST